MEKIIIELQETDTKEFKKANLIQKNAQSNFTSLINHFIYNIDNDNTSKCNFKRVHNTMLINGKRGMGKTSFILSMKDDSSIMKDLCPLEIIDPTLIETKEHVFLNIITYIKDKIEKHFKEQCNEHNGRKNEWKESLKKLAGGLSMLDGIGSNHLQESMWDAPELILEKGLSNAKQGSQLERNFHDFLKISLEILEKKAFFLILDDIDTSLDKGTSILEILRKYLTSPKLIIAMLGDIDLYSTLVRQLQWEKMDPKKILLKYEDKTNYLAQIEHLEEQYLTKVLKPENRINLENLLALKDSLEVKKANKTIEPFNNYIEKLLDTIYLTNNRNYKTYFQNTLLIQSTRSILQLLKAFDSSQEIVNDYSLVYKHTFYTTLKKELESYNLLDIKDDTQFLNLLSMYILQKGIHRDNHLKLIPEFPKDDENIVMLYINSISNYRLKPKNYLEYFIKIGYTLERFIDLNISTNNKNEENIKFQKFIGHIALDSGESTSNISKRLLSSFKIDSNTHNSNPIFLGNLSLSKSQQLLIKDGKNLSLLLSRIYNPKGGSYNFLSFFNLIGLLSDISGQNIEQVKSILTNNNLIREFYILNNEFSSGTEDDDTTNIKEENFDIDEILKEQLAKWAQKANNITQKLPIFILAKIWVRIVYTFNNIEGSNENKKKNYLELIKLYIAGFLNAVYVELELYKGSHKKLDIKNPKTDSNFFNQKIHKDNYEPDNSNYSFFDYLYECPIFKDGIFSSLEKTMINIKFSGLNRDIQIEEIKKIENWESKAAATIRIELRKNGFNDVKSQTIVSLLKEMKK